MASDNPGDVPEITVATLTEAKQNPGGWVYAIEGDYGPNDGVPPEAVRGAWKVDDNGMIEGDFIPNPNFMPAKQRK